MKLSTAAPKCSTTNGDRFVGCGDGTVTDMQTGLVWLADAACFELYYPSQGTDWIGAIAAVASVSDGTCGLTDGSSPGDWRLPTSAELDALLVGGRTYNCHAVSGPCFTNDADTACYSNGSESSFQHVVEDYYWTATGIVGQATDEFPAAVAWSLGDCTSVALYKLAGPIAQVWPVRKIQAD